MNFIKIVEKTESGSRICYLDKNDISNFQRKTYNSTAKIGTNPHYYLF